MAVPRGSAGALGRRDFSKPTPALSKQTTEGLSGSEVVLLCRNPRGGWDRRPAGPALSRTGVPPVPPREQDFDRAKWFQNVGQASRLPDSRQARRLPHRVLKQLLSARYTFSRPHASL